MGRIHTLKFRVETFERAPNGSLIKNVYGWRAHNGLPNQKNLAKFIDGINKSVLPGGVNAHVSRGLGYIPYVHKANLINQFTGDI